MPFTRITTTEDAETPRVITFPGGNVRWYLYRRRPSLNLYLQREVGGVRDPEVVVALPNPAPFGNPAQPGVGQVSVVLDPVDITSAWIYFISDGALWRIKVTSTPVGEEPTTKQFDRTNTRFDIISRPVTGFYREPRLGKVDIPAPTVIIAEHEDPSKRYIIAILGVSNHRENVPEFFEFWRLVDGGNATLFATKRIPGHGQVSVEADAPVSGFILWRVRGIRYVPRLNGPYTSAYDRGSAEATLIGGSGTGFYRGPSVAFVNKSPIKRNRSDTPWIMDIGYYRDPKTSFIVYELIKNQSTEPEISSGIGMYRSPNVVND